MGPMELLGLSVTPFLYKVTVGEPYTVLVGDDWPDELAGSVSATYFETLSLINLSTASGIARVGTEPAAPIMRSS